MLGYPTTDANLREMTRNELGQNPLCHKVARKAQAHGTLTRQVATLTGTILGTISRRNHPLGLSVDYTTAHKKFPDDTDSMNRYADLTGITEARLIANIASGGGPGTVLMVSGANQDEDIAVGLEIITSPPDLIVGTWHPVTASGATLLEWFIYGTGPGTVITGLCQLQGR